MKEYNHKAFYRPKQIAALRRLIGLLKKLDLL